MLPVRLCSPPVNNRVEDGVRSLDESVPYGARQRVISATYKYYANAIEKENDHF